MSWILYKIVAPIVVIGVLIVIHELGHFLVAKWCGVGVVKFSIGFGPSLLRWKRGETVYQISAVPLGGFVRMVGDMPDPITGKQASDDAVRGPTEPDEKGAPATVYVDDDEIPATMLADRSKWFVEKNLWQRSAIVFAGPAFNLISAVIFVFVAGLFYGEPVLNERPVLGAVQDNSPAAAAGLQAGDEILRIADTEISKWEELAKRIHGGPDVPTEVAVKRGETNLTLTVTPKKREIPSIGGEKKAVYLIGIEPSFSSQPLTTAGAFGNAFEWTKIMTLKTYEGLWGMITGAVSPKDLAGPLFIFDAAGKQAKKGFESVLLFMAILSVSLAVLNLLPIPVLDGGHIMFFLIEALLGPISIRKKEFAQQVGLAFLLLLMCFALSNDIRRDTTQSDSGVKWESEK